MSAAHLAVADVGRERLRFPSRAAGPIEAQVAAANDRSRSHAASLLERWIPGFAWADRAQSTDCNTLASGAVASGFLERIDLTAVVDRHLIAADVAGAGLKLVRDGDRVPVDALLCESPDGPAGRPVARRGVMGRLLDEGYTVVMDGIDLTSGPLMRLAEIFERAFGCPCNINAYESLRPATSFGVHWDDQEVVIVQLDGAKDWEVYEPVELSMHRGVHASEVTDRLVWSGTLEPGGVLYVPRGWGHRVTGRDEPTLHLTITLPRVNGLAVLAAALAHVDDREPSGPTAAGIGAAVDGLVDDGTYEHGVAAYRAAMPSRSTQRLSVLERLADDDRTDLFCRGVNPGGFMWVDAQSVGGTVALASHGRILTMDRDGLRAILDVADGAPRPLAGSTGSDTDVLRAAACVGLVEVCGGSELTWDDQGIVPGMR
jgi:hypothetical protein